MLTPFKFSTVLIYSLLLTLLYFFLSGFLPNIYGTVVFFLILFLTALIIFHNAAHRWLPPVIKSRRTSIFQTLAKFRDADRELSAQTVDWLLSDFVLRQQSLQHRNAILTAHAASSESFSNLIVNNLPIGILLFDASGALRIANDAARLIFSDSNLDFNNRQITVEDLFQNYPQFTANFTDCQTLNDNYLKLNYLHYRTHSTAKKLELKLTPFQFAERQIGCLCLVTDVTEISLLRKQKNLQKNLESLELMSAGLAHEFKNSLAALHSYSQLISKFSSHQTSQTASLALREEVTKLSDMVTSFLDFARPTKLNLEPVELSELVEDCRHEVSKIKSAGFVEIYISGEFSEILGDRVLLRQAFINLLHNAVEAIKTEKGGWIRINGSKMIDERNRVWQVIIIADNGSGIAAEVLPYIFIPFYTTKLSGYGIGLALTHKIITQHRGLISAVSSEADGSVFTLKFETDSTKLLAPRAAAKD